MMKVTVFLLWLVLLSGPASAGSSEQQESPQFVSSHPKLSELDEDKPVSVKMSFQDVDIRDFVSYVSEVTGTNFILDPNVKGTVTVVAPTKVPVKEVPSFFQSVLEVHGYTIVKAGSVVKIVPSATARGKSVETKVNGELGTAQDKFVTQVIHLNYLSPADAKGLLTPLVSENSVIVSQPRSGTLIITDSHSNIRRLQRIIKAIDVPKAQEEISVVGK